MATDSIRVSAVIAASPESLYKAWLSGADHSAMTGGAASVEPNVGGRFTAWDGYISGETVELVENRRIVQSWRTHEFPDGSAHSRLEVFFEPVDGGTNLTFVHSEIPKGQGKKYEKGWHEFYFAPMTKHFGAVKSDKQNSTPRKAAAKKNASNKAAPAKASAARKAAPVKSAPAKKAAPVKTTTAKKAAPAAKKAAPAAKKAAAPAKPEAAPAKAAAPAAKKAAPAKAAAKKAAPAKAAAPAAKKAAPAKAAKKAAPAKAAAKKAAPAKAAAPAAAPAPAAPAPAAPRGRAKKSS